MTRFVAIFATGFWFVANIATFCWSDYRILLHFYWKKDVFETLILLKGCLSVQILLLFFCLDAKETKDQGLRIIHRKSKKWNPDSVNSSKAFCIIHYFYSRLKHYRILLKPAPIPTFWFSCEFFLGRSAPKKTF